MTKKSDLKPIPADALNLKLRLNDAAQCDAPDMIAALEGAGFHVRHRLTEIGVVTGWAPAEKRGAIEALAGVVAVEDDLEVQHPPIDPKKPQ